MKQSTKYLIGIFLLVLTFRLYFVFQTDNFSSDDAYFNIRQGEYVKENFIPMFYDELSYGGRYLLYPPLFSYLIAPFVEINILLKIIPEILLSLVIFFIYLITREISGDDKSALIATIISSFIPLFINQTLNQVSSYGLTLIVMLYMVYCFMRIKEGNNLIYFIILSFILPLLTPSAFFFGVALAFYLIFLYAEDIEIDNLNKEAIILATFLILFIGFLIYKKAFLSYGFDIIYQNVPNILISSYFKSFSLLDLIYETGIIPLMLGGFAIFYGVIKERKNNIILLSMFLLIDLLLLSLGWVNLGFGLIFLGLIAGVLSSLSIARFFKFLLLTKFEKSRGYFFVFGIILIIFFLIIPSYYAGKEVIKNTVSDEEIESLRWVRENIKDGNVLGNVYEGNMINAIAKKGSVADNLFLLAKNPGQRVEDIETVYTISTGALASEILQKYGVQYIFLSNKTKEMYNIEDLAYEKGNCFTKIRKGYKVLC